MLRFLVVALTITLVAAGCSDDESGSDGSADNGSSGEPSAASQEGGSESATELSRQTVDDSFGELDEIVTQVMDETGVPGIAVGVVYDDELVYQEGYGVRSVDGDEPVDPETVFQIASLSKPISSTIMAGLAGQGVFDWDDPIADYAPDLQLSDEWVNERVTFADLFSHRSGLPGAPAGNDLEGIGYDRETILSRLPLVPLDGFRDNYSYSNWALTMGGVAGATAAGSDWETVSDEVLFDPAGMASTSMRYDDFVAQENRAALHVRNEDGDWVAEFERDPEPQAPAGGVSSNVPDLAQWVRLQLANGELDGETVIDGEALDQTHVPYATSRPPAPPNGGQPGLYGLGWGLNTEFGLVTWGHSGAFSNGANTTVKLVPAEGLGIIVLSNGAPVGAPETIADSYLSYLLTGDAETDEWLATWTERMAGVYGEPLDLGPQPDEPAPASPAEAYEGTYSNAYVGDVQITADDDGTLEMEIGPTGITYTLDHWDGDTFVYAHAPELPTYLETATFEVVDGQATTLVLTAMDGAGLGTLDRV